MKALYLKYNILIFLVILLISFFISFYYQIEVNGYEPSLITKKDIALNNKIIYKIILNNLLLSIILLTGFLTANIVNYVLISLNGIVFGLNIAYMGKFYNLKIALSLFLPHAIFEISWMLLISSLSVKLFFAFLKFVSSEYGDYEFFNLLKSKTMKKIIILMVLSLIIEIFITPYLFNSFIN